MHAGSGTFCKHVGLHAGILAIASWVVAISGSYFFLTRKLRWLRVAQEVEDLGMDVADHGGVAYTNQRGGSVGKVLKKVRPAPRSLHWERV